MIKEPSGSFCRFWADDSGFLSLLHWTRSQVFDVHGHEKSTSLLGWRFYQG
jgi:hypothetical protein